MLSVSRPARSARTPIARIFLAVLLALVLLAGVAPLSSFSSSSHECAMACCVGKPPHMAGSCSVSLGEERTETPAERGEEVSSAHDHKAHSSGATSTPTKRRGAAKHSSSHHSTSGAKESPRTASIASQAMTAPCSPECAAAALSSSQVRRPRDPAAATLAARPRPQSICFIAARDCEPLPESAERRSLARPRAPPHFLIHFSA